MTIDPSPPPLVHYNSNEEYQLHFEKKYCQGRIYTFDGIRVYFAKDRFGHAFFKSFNWQEADKSLFSRDRAERIDWIKWALENPNAELYEGWDKAKRRYDRTRRVALVADNYVVVIQFQKNNAAFFITAYIADSNALPKIRRSPKWQQNSR